MNLICRLFHTRYDGIPDANGHCQWRDGQTMRQAKLRVAAQCCVLLGTLTAAVACASDASGALLLRDPSVSAHRVAFSYAGFIWIANLDGTHVRQLTHAGHEGHPYFSPDGASIAFAARFDGQPAVYRMPANGGTPTRLTYHPADIAPAGWTPDGRKVIFASGRDGFAPWPDENMRLFEVSKNGGPATPLPFGRASAGSLSADRSRIAYVPNVAWQHFQDAWKRYRGGQTQPIWIARLSDSTVEAKIPRDNSNDFNPMWIGDTIYFLSDRAGPVTLFAYDLKGKTVRQVVENHSFDLKSASASDSTIVYEQLGSLHLFDVKRGTDRTLNIRPQGDFPETKPHAVAVDPKEIRSPSISPTGSHAAFGAHGEILTVNVSDGRTSNLTATTAVSEIDPAWSPDGKSIAYFSDQSGAYALNIRQVGGTQETSKYPLGDVLGFYYGLIWSPDSGGVAYADQHLNYWYIDLANGVPIKIDTDLYAGEGHSTELVWSPDNRWIAYAKQLRSHFHAVFMYSIDEKKSYQITDGQADSLHVAFDRSGRMLYFASSTNVALASGWTDLSSWQRPVTRGVYAVALNAGAAARLAEMNSGASPSLGRERQREGGSDATVDIDPTSISKRMFRLPIPEGNYHTVISGDRGVLYLLETPSAMPLSDDPPTFAVERFDPMKGQVERVMDKVTDFRLAADGQTALFSHDAHWFVAGLNDDVTSVARELPLDKVNVEIDPRPEWRHLFEQVWRDERAFFYDPNLHGLDWEATRRRYEPFLENLSSRDDLNYLLLDMLGNMTIGHMHAQGGDIPKIDNQSKVGLLGADYVVKHGRYCVTRIYPEDPWDPSMRAPLIKPGGEVREGEYLLAVNGVDARSSLDFYRYFLGTAGKPTQLTVGARPDAHDSRSVTVVPLAEDSALRHFAWVERNMHIVERMTGGQVAYVYIPNTGIEGYRRFNREYFAQVGKKAVIVDERYNHGGDISDYIVDILGRPLRAYWHLREGLDIPEPMEGIFGPKVMLINEMTGSGGDALAWLFRDAQLGPLIGKRTWGGLVGHYAHPDDLLDGAYLATPNFAFYNRKNEWEVENHGVPADIEVEDDPRAERQGHDPQLEKAVGVVLEMMAKQSAPEVGHPPYPKYP
jgi:tricorn protease